MIIKETHIFTKIIQELMTDELYLELQKVLINDPIAGDLIKGSGGLRKIRWHAPGQGKRGGVRVIYYWFVNDDEIFMIYAYKKNKQSDLSSEQLKLLRQIVEEELDE